MKRAALLLIGSTLSSMAAPGIDGTVDAPRSFVMRSEARLRDGLPPDGKLEFAEHPDDPRVSTGNPEWDAVHALACHEARLNAVSEIRDGAYRHGDPIPLNAYQTGEKWTYVWTRDLAYATALGLAPMDPQRAFASLWFKTSPFKSSVAGGSDKRFIVQDTGSGGSWPVSSDRVTWALGMRSLLPWLPPEQRTKVASDAYAVLSATLRQDERVLRDPADGLFRGEQSFLDWREQTYPIWTRNDIGAIAASKSLSTNVAFLAAMRSAAYFGAIAGEEDAETWERKAENLRRSIHPAFFDPKRGCYSSLLLRDGLVERRNGRDDLLGTALAILEDVPPPDQAAAILARYPLGPSGPPVVSPQETTVPIYHNCGIWPFATAWWTLAGAKAGHPEVVDSGFRSIATAAAQNLSHMENLDFATGAAWAAHDGIEGPVVNSRRQIWSVAGALGIYHSLVFGAEADVEGIRFRPRIPAATARGLGKTVELRNFPYLGKRIDVSIVLPEQRDGDGFLTIVSTEVDGKPAGGGFVPAAGLKERSRWRIVLGPPKGGGGPSLRRIDPADDFAPAAPEWGDEGISLVDGHVSLSFSHPESGSVTFRVFRDGEAVASGIKGTNWRDPDPSGAVHEYSVEAVDPRGVASHPTRSLRVGDLERKTALRAPDFDHIGGKLREGSHFMDWGKPGDTLTSPAWAPEKGGRHMLRIEFANGAGPVNTGICCGVKLLEVLEGGKVVHKSYAVFPQSGSWERHDFTVPIELSFETGRSYRFRLGDGKGVGNMSYLEHNADYTAHAGGGPAPSHFVDIFAIELLRLDP